MIGITTAGITGTNNSLQEFKSAGVQYIDCSITSILGTPSISQTDLKDVLKLRERLAFYNVSCNSLQSIFYGDDDALGDEIKLSLHLKKCFDVLEALSCNSILFGSPQQRKDIHAATRTVKLMNKFARNQNKTILIENLDNFSGVWGQTALDVQEEISKNSLSNCSINLHVFVEDALSIENLEIERVSSIHLSNKSYSTKLSNINLETLSKVKELHNKIPKLCLEFVNCSIYESLRSFESFREKWECL